MRSQPPSPVCATFNFQHQSLPKIPAQFVQCQLFSLSLLFFSLVLLHYLSLTFIHHSPTINLHLIVSSPLIASVCHRSSRPQPQPPPHHHHLFAGFISLLRLDPFSRRCTSLHSLSFSANSETEKAPRWQCAVIIANFSRHLSFSPTPSADNIFAP